MSEYRGRFAPSPTGPLHFGSLFAAVISYLEAKRHRGKWLLRIENIDPPREQAGAIDAILTCLHKHALIADEPVLYQHVQSLLYEELLDQLRAQKKVYHCPCSRKQLAELGQHTERCKSQDIAGLDCAIKFRAEGQTISWQDGLLGAQTRRLDEDFVLKRKDGLYAYQLAVVADDLHQKITDVVRGADLIDSTPMQLALFNALELPPPKYSHFPVVTNSQGQKLSKQNLARAVELEHAPETMRRILSMLNIEPPERHVDCAEQLAWAIEQWHPDNLDSKKRYTEPAP